MWYLSHTALVHMYPSVYLYTSLSTSSDVGDTSVSLHEGSDSEAPYALDTFGRMLPPQGSGTDFLLSGQEDDRSSWKLVNRGFA